MESHALCLVPSRQMPSSAMQPPHTNPRFQLPGWAAGFALLAVTALRVTLADPGNSPSPALPDAPQQNPSPVAGATELAQPPPTRSRLIPTAGAKRPPTTPASAKAPLQKPASGQAVVMPEGGREVDRNQGQLVEEGGKLWIRDTPLNEIFQFLAEQGGYQFFHNAELEGPAFTVTGHLNEGDPLEQMEEVGLMYGVTVYQKGSTVYALTQPQLAQLPQKPMQYHLKYLRPNDVEQIKTILQPVLTPGSGSIDYESKTNTLVIFDNEQRLSSIQQILAEMDQAKQQIAIETKILRVRSTARNRIGVDWSSVLGDGMTVEAKEALNTLFNLPDLHTVSKVISDTRSLTGSSRTESRVETINRTESGLVLSPVQLRAVLHALNSGDLAQQESCPTLITEDNEEGLITIIDRVPIIIATISETNFGQNISEEVRYRVDPQDSVDPDTSREIGVTVSVTPTILPDDTIRMQLRPRTAQIVEFVQGQSGNAYPRVNESTIQTIARVPNGHSLLIGGVYDLAETDSSGKVPLLGDVPIGNLLFKSTDRAKEQTSLVFVVTPTTYEPASVVCNDQATRYLHEQHVLPPDHASPDRHAPGFNYESRPFNALANLFKRIPPTPPGNTLNPNHPLHQVPLDDATYDKALHLRTLFTPARRKDAPPLLRKRAPKVEVVPAP